MYWSGNGNGYTKYMTILCTDPATATVTLNIWPFYVLIRQRQWSLNKYMNYFMYWSGNGNGHTKYMTILCTEPAMATVTLKTIAVAGSLHKIVLF